MTTDNGLREAVAREIGWSFQNMPEVTPNAAADRIIAMVAEACAKEADEHELQPIAWLTDDTVRFCLGDGGACGVQTVVHRKPLKNGTGLAVYTESKPAAAIRAKYVRGAP